MNARFNGFSIFTACAGGGLAPLSAIAANFAVGLAGYFTPSFLFVTGDRGDHATLMHAPGFGQLLPEQAPLIALALVALVFGTRRKTAVLLFGWTLLATMPAAMIFPLGAIAVEPGKVLPTPNVLFDRDRGRPAVHAMVDFRASRLASCRAGDGSVDPALGAGVRHAAGADVLAPGARHRALHGAGGGYFISRGPLHRSYFVDYPALAAPYFQYGMEQVVENLGHPSDPHEQVVITPRGNEPYIYVLFFERYSPEEFQNEKVMREPGLFGRVVGFDRYLFVLPASAYRANEAWNVRFFRRRAAAGAADAVDSLPGRHDRLQHSIEVITCRGHCRSGGR